MDAYLTIEKPAEGIYRDKGSRFLAFGFPVEREEEVKEILDGIRKKYHDARHHCYAYRLGSRKDIFRMNDDGEPSGTAGKPIYGQLISHDLTNVLVVVVRYFGGTLLGTGGLIIAYRSATADMLSHAALVTRHVEVKIEISFPYTAMSQVMKILKEEALVPANADYGTDCSMVLKVRVEMLNRMLDRLHAVPGMKSIHEKFGD